MGVLVARESAEKTNQTAGDGTTSTVAILQSIMNEGSKYVSAGMNPVLIKKGMDAATDLVIKQLNSLSREIKTQEDKLNIATISANNDQELGKLIVGVVDKIGGDGVVTVTTSNLLNTEVEYLSGTKLSSGYESSIFINDAKHLACELENPVIILTTDRISQQAQLIPILDKILKAGKHDMVLFAEDIEGQALAFLIQNFLQGKFRCVPVKFPSFSGYQKSVMLDIATMVKGQLLGEEQGKKIGDGLYEDCGTCENIVVYRDSTLITGGT